MKAVSFFLFATVSMKKRNPDSIIRQNIYSVVVFSIQIKLIIRNSDVFSMAFFTVWAAAHTPTAMGTVVTVLVFLLLKGNVNLRGWSRKQMHRHLQRFNHPFVFFSVYPCTGPTRSGKGLRLSHNPTLWTSNKLKNKLNTITTPAHCNEQIFHVMLPIKGVRNWNSWSPEQRDFLELSFS